MMTGNHPTISFSDLAILPDIITTILFFTSCTHPPAPAHHQPRRAEAEPGPQAVLPRWPCFSSPGYQPPRLSLQPVPPSQYTNSPTNARAGISSLSLDQAKQSASWPGAWRHGLGFMAESLDAQAGLRL
ncbi:hypothetical protein N7510_002163 [Penicillium lagena]|uniref:uncharacterized protein n=1 Tax=Penicillium lagena TaxID=94218 RepID=UPI00253F94BE|nr:uncharacterized protein N7510_002163 [Penicillium lagena]KAJ5625854.1 hypothetical protein N7510_002163 [Penicillium lagena]